MMQSDIIDIFQYKQTDFPMVSIIIPIYKGEQYIEQIFENVMKQVKVGIEIVFVVDGSPDHAFEKIKDYCGSLKENQLNVTDLYIKNGGVGNARNVGIQYASGKYMMFMDQDDRMDEDYIEKLYDEIERTHTDLVYSGYREVYENGDVKRCVEIGEQEENQLICTAAWAKIYNTSFIQKNDIHFAPVPVGEDIYFVIQAFSLAEKKSCLNYVGYNWVVNHASLSRSQQVKFSEKMSVMPLLKELSTMSNFSTWKKDPVYEYLMIKTVAYYILSSAAKTPIRDLLNYRNDLFSWLKSAFPDFTKNPYVRWNRPSGEQVNVRKIVYIYMKLYQMNLDQAFLRVFSKISH